MGTENLILRENWAWRFGFHALFISSEPIWNTEFPDHAICRSKKPQTNLLKKEKIMVMIIIVSAIVATVLSSILNRNTIGTQGAYVKRWLSIFMVTAFLLMMAS